MGARRRRDEGAVAVEFALILPVLLILIFGLVQYGFYFWSMQGGSSAAREAARRAAVGALDCDDLDLYVDQRLSSIATNTPVVTKAYKKTLATSTFTPSAATPVEVGDVVTVTVTFNSQDMNFPFVPFINDGLVVQEADSRVEYVPYQPQECS